MCEKEGQSLRRSRSGTKRDLVIYAASISLAVFYFFTKRPVPELMREDDATGGQFVFNWQTPKAPGACYKVTMTTQDGSQLAANFKLK